ncbi:MAG: MjaI family restriction endonuclease [Spirochaetales bacterium]|nr:MjaI family restriction endonuclease [Spirochaetales bacterium]
MVFVFKSVLKKIAARTGKKYRASTAEEESKGIDGYIGGQPVSVKPATYMVKQMLPLEYDHATLGIA